MADEHAFLPGKSRETFFAAHFRRTPFVLRGAARTLLEPPLTVAEFEEIRARLAAVSDTVRHALDWPNVWCDAVRTLAPFGHRLPLRRQRQPGDPAGGHQTLAARPALRPARGLPAPPHDR